MNNRDRKDGGTIGDTYTTNLVWEFAPFAEVNDPFFGQMNLTINAGFQLQQIWGGKDEVAGQAALEFQLPLSFGEYKPGIGREWPQISFGGRAKWGAEGGSQYVAQGKLEFNLVKGIKIPLSITYSNRRDLIDEDEVRGIFGFRVPEDLLGVGLPVCALWLGRRLAEFLNIPPLL